METNLTHKLRLELGVQPLDGDELKKATEAAIRTEAARLIKSVGREELTRAARDVNRLLEESLQTKEGRRQPCASLELWAGPLRPYGNAAPEDLAAALSVLLGDAYETFMIRGSMEELRGNNRLSFARLLIERNVADIPRNEGFIARVRAACKNDPAEGVTYDRC